MISDWDSYKVEHGHVDKDRCSRLVRKSDGAVLVEAYGSRSKSQLIEAYVDGGSTTDLKGSEAFRKDRKVKGCARCVFRLQCLDYDTPDETCAAGIALNKKRVAV